MQPAPDKIAVVAVVRDEAETIAEWLAWQFAIGFDAVILLDNASADATRRIATSFAATHDVRILDWRVATPDYQLRGYEHAARQFAAEFAWLAFFDADEFLVLPEHLDLRACLAAAPAAAVAIPWAIFGSSGHHDQPPGLIIENFLHRAPEDFPPCRHVKSIVRPTLMRAALNPHAFDMQGAYTDLTGAEPLFASPGLLAQDPDYATGKLHHYFVQSWSHWQAKLRRGYHDTSRHEAEFFVYDQNEVLDELAKRLAPAVKSIMAARAQQKPETAAVVLVVKNEAADVTAWLAWHHALGFTACIVYDDESTDGTWEILQHAARVQNIRLSRTPGDKSARYELRQEQAYRHALATYRNEFDWLAFFDADEFLALHHDESIQQFLARFPNADAVAISWCNFGSSGHILKPAEPVFDAFTWHGDEHQQINRHVKSIVRPKAVGQHYQNVHCFDIAPHRYVLANGAPAVWSETPGILAQDPDWSVARLMHYQCRSMEHFVERMKLRPWLATRPNIWAGQDVHQLQTIAPEKTAALARAHRAKLQPPPAPHPVMPAHAGIHDYSQPPPSPRHAERSEAIHLSTGATAGKNQSHPALIFDIGMSEGNDTAFYRAKNFRVIGVEPDAQIFAALTERFATDIARGDIKLYNCAASERGGEIVTFHHHNQHQGISGLSNARAEFAPGTYTSYKILTIDFATLAARHGVPHYLKLDIEGHEPAFLRGMTGANILPPYISVKCYGFEPIELLRKLGYQSFQLVNQNPPDGFALPIPQREGATIAWQNWHHCSGPFGQDLPSDAWVDFETIQHHWRKIAPELARTWYDCHACLTPP